MSIKTIREAKGMSIYALAKASGLSQTAISAIESGRKSPTLRTLTKLSIALEVPISELIA